MMMVMAVFTVVAMIFVMVVARIMRMEEELYRPTRRYGSVPPAIRQIVGDGKLPKGVDVAVAAIYYAVWTFVFMVELSARPDFVTKIVGA